MTTCGWGVKAGSLLQIHDDDVDDDDDDAEGVFQSSSFSQRCDCCFTLLIALDKSSSISKSKLSPMRLCVV